MGVEVVCPKTVILDTKDLVIPFRKQLAPYMCDEDFKEVVTQVFASILNGETVGEEIKELPDFNRMRNDANRLNPCRSVLICQHTKTFVDALRSRLHELGAFHDSEFNYFFDGFIGDDLIVSHLPY